MLYFSYGGFMDNLSKLELVTREIEVNKLYYEYQKNISDLRLKWQMGKDLNELTKNKHLISFYANILSKYGYAYSRSYLLYYRKYYKTFSKPISFLMGASFHHIRLLLPIKSSEEKFYYLNLISQNGIGARSLSNLLKNKSALDIKKPTFNSNLEDNVIVHFKGKIKDNYKEIKLLATIKCFLSSLDKIFIVKENLIFKNALIDYLLFSIEHNAYIILLIRLDGYYRKYEKDLSMFINYANKNYKKAFHNYSYGALITAEENDLKIYYYGANNFSFKPYQVYYVNL